MDQTTFDRLARLLGKATTRRHGVLAILSAALGGGINNPTGALGAQPRNGQDTGAKPDRNRQLHAEGPCGDGGIKANRCKENGQCCTGVCKLKRKGKDGRCRCIERGRPCTADRNCCGSAPCTAGVCGGGSQIPTGAPCKPGSDTCVDPEASCKVYDGGDPAGRYCVLPRDGHCSTGSDCASRICLDGRCIGCSHPACYAPCTPNVCPSCPYTTVQAAIDAVQGTANNVVTIASGRYIEDLIVTDDVVLRACPGDRVTLRNATGGTSAPDARRTIVSTGGKLAIIGMTIDGTGFRGSSTYRPTTYGGGIETDSDLGLYANTTVRNGNLSSEWFQ
ncbi:MAG: hypothetical protein ACR2J8_14385, partial [Thermomicrobiales bacterium]